MNRSLVLLAAALFHDPALAAQGGTSSSAVGPLQEDAAVIAATREYERTGQARVLRTGAYLVYPFGHSQPRLTCAPVRACSIQLEEGERPPAAAGEIKPYAGDLERWFVGVTPGPRNTTLVVVQPTDCNLTTNLTIPTDRRLYHLTLDSPPCAARDTATQNPDLPYDRLVRFYYPDDLLRRLATQQHADAEAARAEEARQIPVAVPAFDASALDFGYTVCRDRGFPWVPEQVFSDGSHTYVRLPQSALRGTIPALFEVGERGEMVLINYTLRGNVYVADRVLRRGVLILGTGRPGGELRLLITTNRRDCDRR
jgi:P-type conjugative transfer protein TrbG